MEDVIAQQPGSAVEKESEKSFEEAIGELDKEIRKYDSKSNVSSSSKVSTGKENHVGQPRAFEANVLCTTTHSAHLSLPPRAHLAEIPPPLAEIPHHLVNHG
nr:hypothetical protein CFP56_64796 [Quercus suber]